MGSLNARPARRLFAVGALAAAITATAAGGVGAADHKHTTAKIIKRVVIVENGHKTTVTTFTKNGKTYKRKQWVTRKKGRTYLHTYTYLVRGKKKTKVSGKTTAKPTQSEVKQSMQRQCAPGSPAAIGSALDAFWAHFKAGHLETSPGNQIAEALNVDSYVKLHTVLFQNMLDAGVTNLAGLSPALQELVALFEAHFVSAHMNTSPFEQVRELTSDPDGYARLHTALFANMIAPLSAWADKYARGTPETCTETPASGTPAPAAADVPIEIKNNTFPANVDVGVGSKVTWTNMDVAPHTVSSMHGGPLKSGNFGQGESFSYTFTTAGTFMYLCDVHPDMKGQVTVK